MPSISHDHLNVQYGCGYSCPEGWLNFDASPTVFLERLPVLGRWLRVNADRFPAGVRHGNIVTAPLVASGTATAVYASHVLEHLTRRDCERAVENTFAMLRPGGVFRLVVPDFRVRAERYVRRAEQHDPHAVHDFFAVTLLGDETRPRTLIDRVRRTFGLSKHLWMWDEPAMTQLLRDKGFVNIRRCAFGDATHTAFAAVEDRGRFHDERYGFTELALEATRPEDNTDKDE